MFAEKNEVMQEAAETLYLLTEDDMIREQCLRRQEHQKYMEWMQQRAERLEAEIAQKRDELEQKDETIARQVEEIKNLRNLLAQFQNSDS